jgi:tetratricopeptide (TPR) repeat protein
MELTNFEGTNPISGFLNLSHDYCLRGIFMADEGNLEEALENFNKAIETNPNNHVAYFNRATVKIDLGDIDGAKNDFTKFDIIRSK